MVVVKVLQIKSSPSLKRGVNYIRDDVKTMEESNYLPVERAVNYIANEEKTVPSSSTTKRDFPIKMIDGKKKYQLVSTYGVVDASTAVSEFELTRLQAQLTTRRSGKTSDVLAHHIIQSFSPEDDLSPEEIHEIGRKTVLELTGGQHEFVIATHLDKGHIHNHIIFNATNSVTLKKFRWQKGTRRNLKEISDKYAALAGAKILDNRMQNSRRDYVAYRKKNVFKWEIKERLDFLLKHSTSLEDFKEKAAALSLAVDLSGKEIKYKLLEPLEGTLQERFTRDRTLSKRGNYSLEKLEERFTRNEQVLAVSDIYQAYHDDKAEREADFEMRIPVQTWQVQEETERGIYLELEHGLGNKGVVHIPARYIDKEADGSYTLFIQKKDWFYFTNPRDAQMNKAMMGETVAKQLSYDNGHLILRKNPFISKMEQLIREFNFLSSQGVTSGRQFEDLAQSFRREVETTQDELERLDKAISRLHKAVAVYQSIESGTVSGETLEKLKADVNWKDSTMTRNEVQKLLEETQMERQGLQEHFNSVLANAGQLEKIQENIRKREQGNKIII